MNATTGETSASENPLSEQEQALVYWLTTGVCVLSIFGSGSILGSFYLNPDERKPLRLLLAKLSIFDLFTALLYALPNEGNAMCKIQASMAVWTALSAILYTDAMALYIYMETCYIESSVTLNMKMLDIICVGLPFFLMVLVTGFDVTGRNEEFGSHICWIDEGDDNTLLWQLLAGKVIEWASFVFVCIAYTLTLRKIRSSRVEVDRSISWRLILIPFVFILTRIPSSLRTVVQSVPALNNLSDYFWLSILQAIFTPAQGFVNGLIWFCFSRAMAEKMSGVRWCCCCGGDDEDAGSHHQLSWQQTKAPLLSSHHDGGGSQDGSYDKMEPTGPQSGFWGSRANFNSSTNSNQSENTGGGGVFFQTEGGAWRSFTKHKQQDLNDPSFSLPVCKGPLHNELNSSTNSSKYGEDAKEATMLRPSVVSSQDGSTTVTVTTFAL